jgi:hypothetical protein
LSKDAVDATVLRAFAENDTKLIITLSYIMAASLDPHTT